MTIQEHQKIEQMTNRLLAFVNWKGAPLESKKKKIIKELSMIRSYSFSCLNTEIKEGEIR